MENLNSISQEIADWKILAEDLGLTPAEIFAIKADPHIDEHRPREVLNKWLKKRIFMASYKILASVMLQQSNARLAEKIMRMSSEQKLN